MGITELRGGIHDHGVVIDEKDVPNVGPLSHGMRRRRLQVLRQHGPQHGARAQTALGGHEYFNITPAQSLVIIVRYQNPNALLFALDRRRHRGHLQVSQRRRFFLPPEPDNPNAAEQNSQQQQSDRDLKMARNHGRAPICGRAWAMPSAIPDATALRSLELSRAFNEAEGASSTAMAGATTLLSGRSGLARVATCRPFLRNAGATERAKPRLFSSEPDCALSQGRNRPDRTAPGVSAEEYTRTPAPKVLACSAT